MARRKNTDEVHEILRSNIQDEIEQGIVPLRDALFPKVPTRTESDVNFVAVLATTKVTFPKLLLAVILPVDAFFSFL